LGRGHGSLLALGGDEISAVRNRFGLHDRSSVVVNDHFHERVSGERVGFERVHGELKRAVVNLVLAGDWGSLGRAHDEAVLKGQPGTLQRPRESITAGGGG